MNKFNKKLDQLLANTGDMALKRRSKLIIQGLELRNGDKVLDLGCGDGFYLSLLSKLPLKLSLTGCDVDKQALNSAKRNLSGARIRLIEADLIQGLPFKSESFDKIIISEVLEHLSNDKRGIIEATRVLKKGGLLCISVPSKNYPFLWDPINWILETILNTHIQKGFWSGIWNQHLRLYSKKDLQNLVNKSGLQVAEIKQVTFWCLPFNHYLVNLVARLYHSNSLSKKIAEDLSKFNQTSNKKSGPVTLAFKFVNIIDRLNDVFPIRASGVSIFVKIKK